MDIKKLNKLLEDVIEDATNLSKDEEAEKHINEKNLSEANSVLQSFIFNLEEIQKLLKQDDFKFKNEFEKEKVLEHIQFCVDTCCEKNIISESIIRKVRASSDKGLAIKKELINLFSNILYELWSNTTFDNI